MTGESSKVYSSVSDSAQTHPCSSLFLCRHCTEQSLLQLLAAFITLALSQDSSETRLNSEGTATRGVRKDPKLRDRMLYGFLALPSQEWSGCIPKGNLVAMQEQFKQESSN